MRYEMNTLISYCIPSHADESCQQRLLPPEVVGGVPEGRRPEEHPNEEYALDERHLVRLIAEQFKVCYEGRRVDGVVDDVVAAAVDGGLHVEVFGVAGVLGRLWRV